MEIHIKKSALIRPDKETAQHWLRTTELDRAMPVGFNPSAFVHRRPNDSLNFFEAGLIKEALSTLLCRFTLSLEDWLTIKEW